MAPLDAKDRDGLLAAAASARNRAHAPYSGFRVGAALRAADGRVFPGCNVENASYGLTVCAERTALLKAVSEGARRFDAIALVADAVEPVMPCGACRQVLAEFGLDLEVLAGTVSGKTASCSLRDLLPHAFVLKGERGGD